MIRIIIISLSLFVLAACGKSSVPNDISPGPLIRSVETDYDGKAVSSRPVTVFGANFSPDLAKNEIQLGVGFELKSVKPLEASSEKLVFEAPQINGSSIPMRVISNGKESNSFTLEYDTVRCDSVFLMEGAQVRKLREGVVWTNIYKVWEGAIRSINILSIQPSEINRLAIACPQVNTLTSEQCLQHGAFLGVNGSYFSHTYVKVDGTMVQPGKDQGVNSFMHDGVFTLDNNVPGIQYVGTNARAAQLPNENIMCCGPLLINNNKHIQMVNHSHNTTTHPRTGVAITEDGKVLLVTVDGRFTNLAVGLPTEAFARLLDAFGARYALNLDGGGSTTMWIEGYGIVNHPCDERQWEAPVERKVGSIIYMK